MIGHSLGGLIIRASLSYLKEFKHFFKTLITMGTPHLGCSSSKFLVSTGLKVLSRMKNKKSLREMCIEDEEKYVIGLSERKELSWFKNLILIYAYNDGFVNFESSKILFYSPYRKKEVNLEMANNMYNNIKA